MFQIGSFARLAGVSAKQLRAYDQIGLFRPVWVDPASAYRYYSPAQLPELRRILGLRQLGMPIEEIKRLATGGDLAEAL
jgi:DNA-binding transcriptional MerR regulator